MGRNPNIDRKQRHIICDRCPNEAQGKNNCGPWPRSAPTLQAKRKKGGTKRGTKILGNLTEDM